jgi:hypothetical protein
MPKADCTFRINDLHRLKRFAESAGLTIGRMEVSRDGTVSITTLAALKEIAAVKPATPSTKICR